MEELDGPVPRLEWFEHSLEASRAAVEADENAVVINHSPPLTIAPFLL